MRDFGITKLMRFFAFFSSSISIVLLSSCGGWSYYKPDPAAASPTSQALTSVRLETIERQPIQQTSGSSCWAAAAEMVFRYNGNEDQTQLRIAERMGKIVDESSQGKQLTDEERRRAIEAAGQLEVMLALYPEYKVDPDRVATNSIAWIQQGGDMFDLSKRHMMNAVSHWLRGQVVRAYELGSALQPKGNGRPQPIIVGFARAQGSQELGHICVITGIEYIPEKPTAVGRLTEGTWLNNAMLSISPGEVHRIHYVDPWDAMVKSKTAQEFVDEADFIITREIAVAAIGGIDKAVMPAGQSGVPEGSSWLPW